VEARFEENHCSESKPNGFEISMLQEADIARRYVEIRKVSVRLNDALVRSLSKQTLLQAAEQLGMLSGGKIYFRDMEQSNVLMDFAIHDCREDGRNAVERYLANHSPAPDSEVGGILAAMMRGYYSIFQVESVTPGVGIRVNDLVLREPRFLADRGFSETAKNGSVLATRVFDFSDFVITGGAALPVDLGVMKQIVRVLELPENQNVGAMAREGRARFSATIIRLALGAGNTARIQYQHVHESRQPNPRSAFPPRLPGRNEPCPCGSGKKYKKCCANSTIPSGTR
jgi:hypothetical protein